MSPLARATASPDVGRSGHLAPNRLHPKGCDGSGLFGISAPGGTLSQVTAAMAIDALTMLNYPPVTPSTIRKWAERGKVKKYGRDQFGHQKYELRDIIVAAHQYGEARTG